MITISKFNCFARSLDDAKSKKRTKLAFEKKHVSKHLWGIVLGQDSMLKFSVSRNVIGFQNRTIKNVAFAFDVLPCEITQSVANSESIVEITKILWVGHSGWTSVNVEQSQNLFLQDQGDSGGVARLVSFKQVIPRIYSLIESINLQGWRQWRFRSYRHIAGSGTWK